MNNRKYKKLLSQVDERINLELFWMAEDEQIPPHILKKFKKMRYETLRKRKYSLSKVISRKTGVAARWIGLACEKLTYSELMEFLGI